MIFESTYRNERLGRRARSQVEIANLQLGSFVGNASVVDDEVVRNDELVLWIATQQRTMNVLLAHLTFLQHTTQSPKVDLVEKSAGISNTNFDRKSR